MAKSKLKNFKFNAGIFALVIIVLGLPLIYFAFLNKNGLTTINQRASGFNNTIVPASNGCYYKSACEHTCPINNPNCCGSPQLICPSSTPAITGVPTVPPFPNPAQGTVTSAVVNPWKNPPPKDCVYEADEQQCRTSYHIKPGEMPPCPQKLVCNLAAKFAQANSTQSATNASNISYSFSGYLNPCPNSVDLQLDYDTYSYYGNNYYQHGYEEYSVVYINFLPKFIPCHNFYMHDDLYIAPHSPASTLYEIYHGKDGSELTRSASIPSTGNTGAWAPYIWWMPEQASNVAVQPRTHGGPIDLRYDIANYMW